MTTLKSTLSIIAVSTLFLAVLTGLGQLAISFNMVWLWMAYISVVSSMVYGLVYLIGRI